MRVRRITGAGTTAVAAWHVDSATWIDLDAAAAHFDDRVRGQLTVVGVPETV